MRHRRAGFKLSRNTNERKSLFRVLLRLLILKERVKTTLAKAKAIKGDADKLMTMAKNGSLSARRRAFARLVDKQSVHKLFTDLAVRSKTRTSGFTRIVRLGKRRGDNAEMVNIELVDPAPKPEPTKPATKPAVKTTNKAK